jgi:hypothetical protein
MNKLVISMIGSAFVVAGCSPSYESPMMTFALDASSTKEFAVYESEMTMLDSFQFTGLFGRMVSGFRVDNEETLDQEIVLATKNNFAAIRDLMSDSQHARFTISLEGKVVQAYASGLVNTEQSLTDNDVILFNDYIEAYQTSRDTIKQTMNDVKSIRQDIGSILRSMNRPSGWSAETLNEVFTLSESMLKTLAPLASLYETMLEAVVDAQTLLSGYFDGSTTLFTTAQREQLNRIHVVYEQNRIARDELRMANQNIRILIQSIRDGLNLMREQDVALNPTDQSELALLKLAIQEKFVNGRTLRNEGRELAQTLKVSMSLDKLDVIETTILTMYDTIIALLEQSDLFEIRLQNFDTALSGYFA